MKKLSLLLLVCMVSMLAFAQSNSPSPDDSSGGGPISRQGLSGSPSPDDSTVGDMGKLSDQLLSNGAASCVTLIAPSYNFGNVAVDFSGTATFYLLNGCSVPVIVTSVAVTDPSYPQISGCVGTPVPADGYCEIQVTFTPGSQGIRNQRLIVTDHKQNEPDASQISPLASQTSPLASQTSPLTGTGVADVTLNPPNCSFGLVQVGDEGKCGVTVTNNEPINLAIHSIQITPPGSAFSEVDDCPKSLGPNKTCHITVTFTPILRGLATAELNVNTDSGDGTPPAGGLTGMGFMPKCQPPGCPGQ